MHKTELSPPGVYTHTIREDSDGGSSMCDVARIKVPREREE